MNIFKLPFTIIIRLYYKLFPIQYRIDKWKNEGCPPPPPRQIKFETIKKYKKAYSNPIFIETGTFMGDTTNDASKIFNTVFSIELDDNLYLKATERFKNKKNVHIIHGDSAYELENLLNKTNKINENCIFWLDGHFSEGITAKGELNTPIIKELKSINEHNKNGNYNHAILIDDAHLFNGTADYPTIDKMKQLAKELFPNSTFKVDNNIIVIL